MKTAKNLYEKSDKCLAYAAHAIERMAQRNLEPSEIELVVRYGQMVYRTGVQFFFLGARNIPQLMHKKLSRLIGTTVIVDRFAVRTAYRNAGAIRRIKRKPKCRRPPGVESAYLI